MYQEQYECLFNLEATPAESTTYHLAKHDKEEFSNIITASKGGGTPYYTNSSHLSVGCTDDIFEALGLQNDLQPLILQALSSILFLVKKCQTGKALNVWYVP